jgi:hypothetical protein
LGKGFVAWVAGTLRVKVVVLAGHAVPAFTVATAVAYLNVVTLLALDPVQHGQMPMLSGSEQSRVTVRYLLKVDKTVAATACAI